MINVKSSTLLWVNNYISEGQMKFSILMRLALMLAVFIIAGCVQDSHMQDSEMIGDNILNTPNAVGIKKVIDDNYATAKNSKTVVYHNKIWVGSKWSGYKNKIKNERSLFLLNSKSLSIIDAIDIVKQNGIVVNVVDANRLGEVSTISLSFKGKFSDFIKVIEKKFNISIEIVNPEALEIAIYQNKIFSVAILDDFEQQSTEQSSTDISGSSQDVTTIDELNNTQDSLEDLNNDSSDASTGAQTLNETSSSWDYLQKSILSILNGSGDINISRANHIVSVNAPGNVLKNVQRFIQKFNATLTRQVLIDVEVYSVVMSEKDAFNFSLRTLFNNGSVSLTTADSTAINPSSGQGNLSAEIVSAANNFTGGAMILGLLSGLGDVSVVEKTSAITLNGRTAPIKMEVETSYVKAQNVVFGETTTGVATNKTWVKVETDSVTSGFDMKIMPLILDEKKVMLKYKLSKKELVALLNYGSDETQIQVPTISTKEFEQQLVLNSGEALVLAGFQSDLKSDTTQKSISEKQNYKLTQKELFIIVVKPTIMTR